MNINKKIQFATEEEDAGTGVLALSYRSNPGSSTDTGTLCADENTDFTFYMFSSTEPTVTTGDIAYNTNNLTSPFNGENKFYKVTFATGTEADNFIVQINGVGVMTVIETCSI
jgi:hypothetical protein